MRRKRSGSVMNINKKQLFRLVKFIGQLKENRYPNCKSFSDEMRRTDIDGNINISCSAKTIQRDIKLLKEYFNAPIEFNTELNGFYLTNHGWNFNTPIYSEEELIASVLGAKLAEDIMPEPIKSEIRRAVDMQLTDNNPDFLDTATISTFIAASGVKVKIDPVVFGKLFKAWQHHKSVKMLYKGHEDEAEHERQIDPYIITYYNSSWYVKGYCHLRNAVRIFAIHRIKQIEILDKSFETPTDILKEPQKGEPFEFEEVKDIEVWCAPEIAGYVLERSEVYKQTYEMNEDGSLNLHIKSAPAKSIIKWILSEGGNARLIKPKELAEEIKMQAKKVILIHV
ncbi:MAG: WYL domain-containing protein [Lentisphaerota bacterium]